MHFLTSAKQNENIDELFLELSKKMIKASDEKQSKSVNVNRSNSIRRQLRVEDVGQGNADEENESTGSGRNCCGR